MAAPTISWYITKKKKKTQSVSLPSTKLNHFSGAKTYFLPQIANTINQNPLNTPSTKKYLHWVICGTIHITVTISEMLEITTEKTQSLWIVLSELRADWMSPPQITMVARAQTSCRRRRV